MSDGLEQEKNFFESKRKEWLKDHANEWVWIHGSQFEFFPNYEKAVEKAYSEGFNNQPIFIKQITEKDEVPFVAGYYDWAI